IYDSFYVILMTDRSLYDICSFWYVVIRRNRIERRRLHEIVSQLGERGMRYLTKRKKLSKVLIRERKRRGLSQQEVANAVDTSLRNYQRWESGETFPQPYYWLKLQGFFGECLNEVTVFDVQEHPLQDRLLAGDQEDTREVPPQERQ